MKVKGVDNKLAEYCRGMIWRPKMGQLVGVIDTCKATNLIGRQGKVIHVGPPVVRIDGQPYCLLSRELEPVG